MKNILLFIGVITMGMFYTSCGSDDLNESNIYAIEIYLTDDPVDAEEVNIEILSVVLKGDDASHEIELNTISGIYNLLDFQGDIDTLIASGNYDLDNLKEIRLILGSNNSIKIDGQKFPLEIPSGSENGLKIKVDEDFIGQTLVSLLIDFDACKSIKEMNGSYKLSPVIHYKGNRNKKDLDLEDVIELDSCYTIEFPVNVKNVDGTISAIGSYEELIALIEGELITGIVYPFNVIGENGQSHKINNSNQAEKLNESCDEEDEEGNDFDFVGVADSILGCYDFQYPFAVVLEDGTIAEVLSDADLAGLSDVTDFVYPFYVVDKDGDVKEINNINQLEAHLKNCDKKSDDGIDFVSVVDSIKGCYDLQYPLAVVLKDGTIVDVFSDMDLAGLSDVHDFVYPFYVVDNEGDVKKINNIHHLEAQLKNCDKKEGDGIDFISVVDSINVCYELQYPFAVVLKDGTIVDVFSDMDLAELSDVHDFVYPFYVVDNDGDVKKINNIHHLEAQLKNCDKKEGENNSDFNSLLESINVCFDLQYPFSVVLKDGMIMDVYNDADLAGLSDVVDFVYPFYVVDEEGEEKKINNANQLEAQLKNCGKEDEDLEDLIGVLAYCYELSFPVNMWNADSMEISIDSLPQLIDEIKAGNVIGFVFDITVVDKEGNTIVVSGYDQLVEMLSDCKKEESHNDIFDKIKDCVSFEFPISIVKNGELIQAGNLDELKQIFESGGQCSFVFPFNIIAADDKRKKITNRNKLIGLLSDCE